jgi:hypothetical protein
MSRKGTEHILRSSGAVVLGLVFAACGGGSSTKDPGTLGGACYANGACNPGLECAAGICAPALPGLDAAPIPDAPLVEPDLPVATPDLPVAPAVDLAPDIVIKQDACVPACTNKACGADDGCAGKCKTGTCAAGSTCQNGFCCGCTAGQQCCQGVCAGLAGDSTNCGLCGNACTSGMSCVGGACGICTPNCTGKTCGPDGCGGVCGTGTCPTGQGCISGTCQACNPACNGLNCGPDGCGGVCGKCKSGQSCAAGVCQTCTPSCTGKQCGEDDGCGGGCQTGTCAGGGTCSNGMCVGACTPDCSGKNCGSDGCGGKCGSCAEGFTCSGAGVCQCKPTCATTGYLCGSDGCGGICGTACSGTTPTCVPAKGCMPDALTVGCSDLTREGFKDLTTYPTIAGCQGSWPEMTMRTTKSGGVTCGNDIGSCPTPANLCADGWHICMTQGWPGDITSRIDRSACMGVDSGTVTFSAASQANATQSPRICSDCGGCCGNVADNAICCGRACQVCNSCSAVWPSDTPTAGCADCGGSSSNGNRGVLCCKNPEITGS